MHLLSCILELPRNQTTRGQQMQEYDINNILKFQDVKVKEISMPEENIIYITLELNNYIQKCPCCNSIKVIRKGSPGIKEIRHLDMFQYKTIVKAPIIRFYCNECNLNFTYEYSFVTGKSRYTNDFKEALARKVNGSTVIHLSEILDVPYSSAERFFKSKLPKIVEEMQECALKEAKENERLVLGIDDFAIRKGHRYNTGIHDLKNGKLVHISEGRRLEELLNNETLISKMTELNPIAIVMDLAKSYHNFAKEIFPDAIRVADRFHVNRFITEALHDIRKRICKRLPSNIAKAIKKSHNLLEKRRDSLSLKEVEILEKMLNASKELKDAYEFKEKLINWYDFSNKFNAKGLLEKWIQEGKCLEIAEIADALKTFDNWFQEIVNYHYCRFTNASVEGRHNKIKALQRKCFFLRNRQCYEQRIYLECNKVAL